MVLGRRKGEEVGIEEIGGEGIKVLGIEVEGAGIGGIGGNVTGIEKIGGAGMKVEGVEVEVNVGIEVEVLNLGGKLRCLVGRRGFFQENKSLGSSGREKRVGGRTFSIVCLIVNYVKARWRRIVVRDFEARLVISVLIRSRQVESKECCTGEGEVRIREEQTIGLDLGVGS